jgi:hypothetical protein
MKVLLVLTRLLIVFSLCCWVQLAQKAQAETPIIEPGDYGMFDRPQFIPEAQFMWFVMGELSSTDDQDAVTFDYRAGTPFKAEIFIPAHPELRCFQPSIVLIGPGLPQLTEPLPFALPPGMGALVAHHTRDDTYFDIFTGMTFYPGAKIETVIPQTSRYFVVTYGQPVGMARYALDIGVTEDFRLTTVIRYPVNWYEVRDYLHWGHWPIILMVVGLITLIKVAARAMQQRRRRVIA